MKGIAREKGQDRRRVRPLMAGQAVAMMADLGPRLADCRDAALLALGIAMAARRSELAGLDWLERGTGDGVLELTEHGAVVRLFTSKTAQARAVEVHVQPGPALKAVKDWPTALASPRARRCFVPSAAAAASVANVSREALWLAS